MKPLFLLLALIFSSISQASWIALSELEKCSSTSGADLFSHKSICEGDKKSECVEFPGGPCYQYDIVTVGGKKTLKVNQSKKDIIDEEVSAKHASLESDRNKEAQIQKKLREMAVKAIQEEGK